MKSKPTVYKEYLIAFVVLKFSKSKFVAKEPQVFRHILLEAYINHNLCKYRIFPQTKFYFQAAVCIQ